VQGVDLEGHRRLLGVGLARGLRDEGATNQ
jgi:hypothetical protein